MKKSAPKKKSPPISQNKNLSLVFLAIIIVLLGSMLFKPSNKFFRKVLGLSSSTYYISPNGSDTNPGTSALPFKTYPYAQSKAVSGDTIYFMPGTYKTMVEVTKNGLNIIGQNAIIDATGLKSALQIHGNDIIVDGIEAMHSNSHIVYITGKRVTLRNSYIHDGIYENRNSTTGMASHGNWGSGVSIKHDVVNKVERMAENVKIDNVVIERVYGEGIDTYGVKNVTVTNSTIKDAYSIGYYIDNSSYVTFENNFANCSGDARFKRSNGEVMTAFSMATEKIEKWYPTIVYGPQLHNARIVNNISYGCNGISMWGTEYTGVANNGLSNSLIAHNTILATPKTTSIYLAGGTGITHSNVKVVNNLVSGSVSLPTGTVGSGNLTKITYVPSTYSPTAIKPTSGVNKGVVLADVTKDFGGATRDNLPDVGAWEINGVVVTTTVNPTSTPTIIIATPTPTPTPTTIITATPTTTPTPTSTISTNSKPVIKSAWFSFNATKGALHSSKITATDPNLTDTLTMSVTGLPTGITKGSCSTQNWGSEIALICNISGTPTTKGSYPVTVKATDNKGGSSAVTATFTVW